MIKGLEALKTLEKCKWHFSKEWLENYPIVEKELKALEIIRNIPDNYKEGLLYTFQHLLVARKITKEEYDLLKEVML